MGAGALPGHAHGPAHLRLSNNQVCREFGHISLTTHFPICLRGSICDTAHCLISRISGLVTTRYVLSWVNHVCLALRCLIIGLVTNFKE